MDRDLYGQLEQLAAGRDQIVGERYQVRVRSAVLRGIDLQEVERIARDTPDDRQTSAVRAFQRALSRRRVEALAGLSVQCPR